MKNITKSELDMLTYFGFIGDFYLNKDFYLVSIKKEITILYGTMGRFLSLMNGHNDQDLLEKHVKNSLIKNVCWVNVCKSNIYLDKRSEALCVDYMSRYIAYKYHKSILA